MVGQHDQNIQLEGGTVNAVIALGHELFHAYQDDTGIRPSLTRNTAESQATYFQNYLTSVLGYGNMRTSYGSGLSFSNDESVYNPENEKITNLSIIKNPVSFLNRTFTDGRSDGTMRRISILIGRPSYTITFEKSYTVQGKEVKQSIKKTNEPKISQEE